jgi:acid phosphatase type 7
MQNVRPMVALVLAIAVAAAATAAPTPSHDPVIAAAGDIACDPRHRLGPDIEAMLGGCEAAATYALIAAKKPVAVLVLGDAQYEDGALEAFQQSYAKTWGQSKPITHPTPGNHEYYSSPTADGYFTYFGAAAGDRAKGYYSYDLGTWHMIALNGNCSFVGGCGAGSKQETWLKADLAGHPKACTLAYWHQPRFSSGAHHSDPTYADLWRDLYAARADVVLGGHDHDYERFGPQTPSGDADPSGGIREFVVGTGGRSHSIFLKIEKNSESRAGGTFGVLFLTLHPSGYEWRFTPIAGFLFSDSGSATCHGRH